MRTIKFLLFFFTLAVSLSASAKKYPEIKFDHTTLNMGEVPLTDPVKKVKFKFTNTGKSKLVINAVHASCGCTVAEYPKDFIAPGASGYITVTFNATGKMPSKFKKSIQVFSNCKQEMTRLYIMGEITDVPVSKK